MMKCPMCKKTDLTKRSRFMNFKNFKIEDFQLYCKKCGWWKSTDKYNLHRPINLDDF